MYRTVYVQYMNCTLYSCRLDGCCICKQYTLARYSHLIQFESVPATAAVHEYNMVQTEASCSTNEQPVLFTANNLQFYIY